jgi:carboxymethylenebutenolidase
MPETIQLTAADGHKLACYASQPKGKPRGGLVIVQEIFGVNRHMRGVAEGYVADGYSVAMPALFDRVELGVELGYGDADIARGRELRGKIAWEQVLADVAAAAASLKGAGKLGVVGYCWGGSVTWLSATRLKNFSAAVCYYGGQVAMFADEKANCAVMMHFGDKDQSIPMSDVEKVRAAQKGAAEIHVYPAGHGFNCEERGSYHAESAKIARDRTLAFFRKHVG